MVFNLIFFALFGAVAFFQYTQGFFSATIAAFLAIIASLTAISYHEAVAVYLMKFPEYADAIAIAGLYAVAYVIPKVCFDQFVPGNVRFPFLVDKIGAGAMGVIAGLFSTGTIALAAQTLPFGPDIGYFSRQDLGDSRPVTVMYQGRNTDMTVSGEVLGDKLGDQARGMWLNQDALVLGFASGLSSPGGTLADDHPLSAVHPNYLTELFAERLGLPAGSDHVAAVTGKSSPIHVEGAYSLPKLPRSLDGEDKTIRSADLKPPDVPSPDASTGLIVLTVQFNGTPDIVDTDKYIRLSPASVRLKAGDNDYYPVGTLVGGILLLKNRIDDPLLIDAKNGSATVSFLFVIDKDNALVHDAAAKTTRFKDGSFLQFKRYALVDLSGLDISSDAPPRVVVEIPDQAGTDAVLGGIVRKPGVTKAVVDLIETAKKAVPPQANNPNQNSNPDAGRRLNNELDPTQIPIHGMGL